MKQFKRIALCLFAALVVALGIFALPVGADATTASGTCGDDLNWALDDSGALTISGNGAMYDFYDPMDVPWYDYRDALTSVVVQEGATSIGHYAFYYCINLESVMIPEGVTGIGDYAFTSCYKLTSLTVPYGVSDIGTYAFSRCIGLVSVTLPGGVTYIGNAAFYYCSALQDVYYGGSEANWAAINMGTYNDGLTNAAIHYNHVHEWTTPVTVEPTCTENGYIEYTCVHGESYRKILPALGHGVGADAVVTPPTCTEEGYTTTTCPRCGEKVKDQFVPVAEHSYVDHICQVCSAAELKYSGTFSLGLGWALDYAGNLTISGSGYMSGYYDPMATPWYTWREEITAVVIEDGITSIGAYVFYGCENLASVTIPESVMSIGEYAFYGCSGLAEVTIPYGVTSIPAYTFSNCTGLTGITIPNSVRSIGEDAFDSCTALETVFYKGTQAQWENVTVGTGNTALTSANLQFELVQEYTGVCGENLTWELDVEGTLTISGLGAMTDYAVPKPGVAGSMPPWYAIASSVQTVVIQNGVTTIGGAAFYSCTNLTSVAIPASVGSIGTDAFNGCSRLREVTIPNSVTTISDTAFSSCSSLEKVSIGSGVTHIGNRAFFLCNSLQEIRVDANNPSYSNDDKYVLFNKDKTTLIQAPNSLSGSYTLPSSVTTIGKEAFYGCEDLTAVILGSKVSGIHSTAFNGCANLTEIRVNKSNANYCNDDKGVLYNKDKTILVRAPGKLSGSYTVPNGVTDIYAYAFFGCRELTEITIPDSVLLIDYSAFSGRDSLENVYYGGTQDQWASVDVTYDNDRLTASTIHYHTHNYTADPTTCSDCGKVRIELKITTATLRANSASMYFKGTFKYDQDVSITRYGIVASLYNPTPMADGRDSSSLYTLSTKGALITNILSASGGAANAQRPIYARAYMLLSDGTMIYSEVVSVSLQELVEKVDSTLYADLNSTQKLGLSRMYNRYSTIMNNWNIPNIKENG